MPLSASLPRASRAKLGDVAVQAGVSTGTASNALNHPERVAPETLAKVETAIRELGFLRNGAASTLASGSSHTIGLVVVDLMNSLFVDMARGAQRAARESRLDVQLADCDNDVSQQDSHLDFLAASQVAGVLLAPLTEPDASVRQFRTMGRPIVMLNYAPTDDEDFCTVVVDNKHAGYIAAQHMLALGRRRIAFVGGLHGVQPVAQRLAGVMRAVAETNGAATLVEIDTPDLNPPSGAAAAREILSGEPNTWPDAVIAVTDLLAMAMVTEFVAARVSVPDDIAVMGCDHNSAAWGGAIPLTSISMEGKQMGEVGVDLLRTELAEPASYHRHRTVVLEPHLVVRESTAGRS